MIYFFLIVLLRSEYGPNFELCLPWITQHCPEALSPAVLADMLGDATIEDEEGEGGEKKKKSKRGNPGPKKKAAVETKIVISRVQRQKRKYITTVVGLDTVPELKLKDAAKVFGKKFSSGASVSDTAAGGKEIVIQGDVCFELPPLLISEFKVYAHNYACILFVLTVMLMFRYRSILRPYFSLTMTAREPCALMHRYCIQLLGPMSYVTVSGWFI